MANYPDRDMLYLPDMDIFSYSDSLYYVSEEDEVSAVREDFVESLDVYCMSLTDKQGMVIALFLTGCTFRQISVLMNISVSTTHKHFGAAVERFKKLVFDVKQEDTST